MKKFGGDCDVDSDGDGDSHIKFVVLGASILTPQAVEWSPIREILHLN